MNEGRASKLLEELIEVFKKHRPTVDEIVIVSGNLLYTLGASIEGYGEKGPRLEELKKLYYENPGRVGIALMLQAMTQLTWYEDILGVEDRTRENNESNQQENIRKNES